MPSINPLLSRFNMGQSFSNSHKKGEGEFDGEFKKPENYSTLLKKPVLSKEVAQKFHENISNAHLKSYGSKGELSRNDKLVFGNDLNIYV